MYNRDFPKEYADWKKTDPFELFSAETVKRPVPKTSTVKLLASVAQGCDTLILWLDNDREGENICFEV